jgi:hypothetical protein
MYGYLLDQSTLTQQQSHVLFVCTSVASTNRSIVPSARLVYSQFEEAQILQCTPFRFKVFTTTLLATRHVYFLSTFGVLPPGEVFS